MTKIMTLICERSCDLDAHVDSKSQLKEVEGCYVVKFPCSGMIQPLMIEAALKNGADGVVVTGCQIGDCYYREGNRMIRERLLGDRPPGLKKGIDRRRVIGLWLSKVQPQRLISEVKEFIGELKDLPADKPADKPAAAKPAAKPAAPKPEPAAEAKPETAKAEEKKEESKPVETPKAEETKAEAPKEEAKAEETKAEAPKAEEAKAEAKEEAKSEEPKSEDK